MGKSCRKLLWENLAGNCCGKILREIVVGKSCEKWRRGKSQLKKASDWWKFSIWNRVMGSQPIRIQLRKILQEILVGNCCGKILREIVAGKSCGKLLWENLAGNSCGKILQEILAGNGGGEKANLRKPVIGGNLVFGIGWWGANQSGSSSGKSCRKILQEIVAGNCCGKILWEIEEGKKTI